MTASRTPPVAGDDSALRRVLGFWSLTAAVVNLTVGGAIFALPGSLAASLGPAAPWAFVAGALLFAPIVLCIAAAGSRVTATGGPYSYVDAAFGRFPAFATAIILWISCVAGSGSMASALIDQLAHEFPALQAGPARAAALAGLFAALAVLNGLGVRTGSVAVIVFSLAKALPMALLLALGLPQVDGAHLHITALPDAPAVATSLVLVVFAYSGVEMALAPSGEVREAHSAVPRAALAGVAIVVALYVGLQVLAQGALGPELAGNAAPFATIADRIAPGAAVLVVATASLSLVGSLAGDMLASSRLLYAMGRDGHLPAGLAVLGARHRAPVRAILVHAASACALAMAGSFTTLALVSGGAFCLVYIACCAAAWRLCAGPGTHRREGRFPLLGGAFTPLAAIAALLWILSSLSRQEWLALGVTLAGATAWYALRRRRV